MTKPDFGLLLRDGFEAGAEAGTHPNLTLDDAMSHRSRLELDPYRNAFILGFFSKKDAVPEGLGSIYEEAYKSEAGQRVLELGYCKTRPELE